MPITDKVIMDNEIDIFKETITLDGQEFTLFDAKLKGLCRFIYNRKRKIMGYEYEPYRRLKEYERV